MPDDTEETAPAERAHRIEIRPRLPGPRQPEAETSNPAEFPLNFTCPACGNMMQTAAGVGSTSHQCPSCQAWVIPPQLIRKALSSRNEGKSHLPPPRKTGTHSMRDS
jgi:predicted RNA-binding Zn-ribbon protein involved in translation (DUF1610 family)